MRIWIDTDIGTDVDDALALAYVLRQPELELVGVSTVFGDVSLRSQIAEELLKRADASRIPVVTGLGRPLSPARPGLMLGHEGVGLLESPAPRLRTDEDTDADQRIDQLAETITKARPDWLVAIGPMSNLGALAKAGAELPSLAIMGGKLQDVLLEGMPPGIEEWNWFCDPVAVQHVLAVSHTTPPRIVPADVTWQTELPAEDVERLADGDSLARAIATLCGEWLTALRDRLGASRPRVALHDPLTAATLVEPNLCPFEPRRIRVDDQGRTTHEPDGTLVEAAVDVEQELLRTHLMEAWLPTS